MADDSCPSISYNLNNAAVIGPSGIMIRPYGDNSFTELKTLYREKIENLPEGYEFFSLEGISLLADMRAAIFECRKLNKPILVTLSINGERMSKDELPADAALIVAQSLKASCFAIEAESEDTLVDCIAELRQYARIPLGIRAEKLSESTIETLVNFGVTYFFGADDETKAIAERLLNSPKVGEERESIESMMLANEREAFYLEHDTTEISDPYSCSFDMGDELYELDEMGFDVIRIQLDTPDDALDFAENAHMTSLPVMFSSDDLIALKLALMLYQGRALIDKESLIDEEDMIKAAEKYGAIIY